MSITQRKNHQDLMDYVNMRLTARESEKKLNGEVFTPLELINGREPDTTGLQIYKTSRGGADSKPDVVTKKKGMLDYLPETIWTEPDLKWLDPANGIGNFPICVYYRLMKGLKTKFPDEEKRSKHIIENMLYMVELDPVNVSISRSIFCGKGIKPNIYQGDFLEVDLGKVFGVDKFDVIMGNPPYKSLTSNKSAKGVHGPGNKILWDKFIIKSLKILISNGYLCFMTPSKWRQPESDLWKLLSKKQIIFLHIFSKKNGIYYFNSQARFDIYIVQNRNNYKKSEVIDEKGYSYRLNLNKWKFLPNYYYYIFEKILNNGPDTIDVIYNGFYTKKNCSEVINQEYKYPVMSNINNKGIIYIYTNDKSKGHFGIPKFILNKNEKQYSYPEQNDYNGRYGMNDLCFGLPIKSQKEGEEILKAIQTEVFKTIIKATKWGVYQTEYKMFRYFKKNWYKIVLESETSQTAGSNSFYLKSYLKENHHYLLNFYNKIKQNNYNKTNNQERQKTFRLIDLFQQKGGHKMRESNFNEIIRNLNQPQYLKQLFYLGFDNQIGGHSRRIRPFYYDYKEINK